MSRFSLRGGDAAPAVGGGYGSQEAPLVVGSLFVVHPLLVRVVKPPIVPAAREEKERKKKKKRSGSLPSWGSVSETDL